MASEGPRNPGTATSNNSYGTASWSSPNNSFTSNNSTAGVSVPTTGATEYLHVSNFGFSIPSGATIDGIVVEVERDADYSLGSNYVSDDRVRIVKGGSIGSTDKSSGALWPSADAYATYGSSSDLWGESWTDSDINSSTFGFVIAAKMFGGVPFAAYVDHIRITVYYTEGGGGAGAARLTRSKLLKPVALAG